MSLDYFTVERGFKIDTASGDPAWIAGTIAPGTTGDSTTVDVGSEYSDLTTGFKYTKITAGSGVDKWRKLVNEDDIAGFASGTFWTDACRVKEDALFANLAAAEVQMNAGLIDGLSMAEDDRILFTNITGEQDNIYTVVGTPGAGATLDERSPSPPIDGTTTWIQTGATAFDTIWVYDGADWVQRGGGDQDELNYIRLFVGKTGAGPETPTYSSTFFITNTNTLEVAIGDLDTQLKATDDKTALAHVQTDAAVSVATNMDPVLVDVAKAVKWIVHCEGSLLVDAAKKLSVEILAIHDGHNNTGGADAAAADFNVSGKLKLGNLGNITFDIVFTGSTSTQAMNLRITPSATALAVSIIREIIAY